MVQVMKYIIEASANIISPKTENKNYSINPNKEVPFAILNDICKKRISEKETPQKTLTPKPNQHIETYKKLGTKHYLPESGFILPSHCHTTNHMNNK